MRVRARRLAPGLSLGLGFVALAAAWGQAPPTSAKVDVEPLELTEPERYAVASGFEPVRRVTLVATSDGIVRSQDAKAGASVREGQEVAQLDRGEAGARLKIAQAEVKEHQAALAGAKEIEKGTGAGGQAAGMRRAVSAAEARVEAAQARAEIAQIEFDRCSLKAPFSGRLLSSPVTDGQFVAKGTVIADLADVSSLRALVPVLKAGASVGGSVTLRVEGQAVVGKIQALLPLPESLAIFRDLSSPITAAWVVVANPTGALEPGERVVSPALPTAPIATIPAHALRSDEKDRSVKEKKNKEREAVPAPGSTATVQVIRNEYVNNVKVRVLGTPSPERVQVTGPLRSTDALIVSSSVPLLAGTLIRFNPASGVGTVEGTSPDPAESGATADLTPPRAGSRAAPIGAPGSAVPKGRSAARQPAGTLPAPPAAKPAAAKGSVPF